MLRSLIACACAVLLPLVASAVTMEMVTVGNPGNAPDPLNTNAAPGIGSVDYTYQIGKYEVINSQYAEFLNSVAASDAYGLYNTAMSSEPRGGIDRSGLDGGYTYSVKANMGDKPVNYVSFYDSVRFVNWLQNGQPMGAQGAGTTETGSYTLFTDGPSTTNVSARTSSGWVIPTENEWYKAAYHQPESAGGPSNSYWLYPTQSDSAPTAGLVDGVGTITNDGPNVANYLYAADWNGQNGNVTTVGSAGSSSDGYYGTCDQGGNVYERVETIIDAVRGMRGGAWSSVTDSLRTEFRRGYGLSTETDGVGFRVAAIPKTPSLRVASTTSNGICLTMNGSVGLSHVIEVSGDLTNWQPWAIVTLPAGGWSTNFVTDPDVPRRFWRARQGEAPPGLLLIPPGNFEMGNSFDASEGAPDELPRHTVYVSAFYMQSTETTKAQWDDVRSWGSTNGYNDLSPGGAKAVTHPVCGVNWYDIVKWCNARSEKEGLAPCYYTDGSKSNVYRGGELAIDSESVEWNAKGYRLPTEAEWEKAARGGSSGHRFPWSDADTIEHSRANYYSSASYAYDVSPTQGNHPTFDEGDFPFTSPVASFSPNGYGLFDMAGNVWEWCWDRYSSSYDGNSESSDPTGPTSGWRSRILRGGDWGNSEYHCRVGCRGISLPSNSALNVGFRPVRR